jgi:tetratricopeptide (TPR) repeat protein
LIQYRLEKLEKQLLSDAQISEWKELVQSPEYFKDAMTLANMGNYLEEHGYEDELITSFRNDFTINLAKLSQRNFEEAVEIHQRAKGIFRKAHYIYIGERYGELVYQVVIKLLEEIESIFLYILKIKMRLMGYMEAQKSIFAHEKFLELLSSYRSLYRILCHVMTSLVFLKEQQALPSSIDLQHVQQRSHKIGVQLEEFASLSLFKEAIPLQIEYEISSFEQHTLEQEIWRYRCNICLLHNGNRMQEDQWIVHEDARYHRICERFFLKFMHIPLPRFDNDLKTKG